MRVTTKERKLFFCCGGPHKLQLNYDLGDYRHEIKFRANNRISQPIT